MLQFSNYYFSNKIIRKIAGSSQVELLSDYTKEVVPFYEGARRMNGVLFLLVWIGCASLHTLFDLKIKPVLDSLLEDSDLH